MITRVFYLDDETYLLEIFSDSFSSDTVSVTTFNDPAGLLNECEKNPPDILFLDYRMPGTTGDQVAQKLDPKIPKYLITGDLQVTTIYKFKNIFYKPFDDEIIKKTIEGYSK